jgi:hypothetical protein
MFGGERAQAPPPHTKIHLLIKQYRNSIMDISSF